nr:MAG TPA: hypothetical protein [Caudoviricetes sp.]
MRSLKRRILLFSLKESCKAFFFFSLLTFLLFFFAFLSNNVFISLFVLSLLLFVRRSFLYKKVCFFIV